MITPYDVSDRLYGHLEPFKYFGCTVQTRKYFIENYKATKDEAEEWYNNQFTEIETFVA